MATGDHLTVNHGLYTHHGIDLGDGQVIHYGRGLSDLRNARVEIVSMELFSGGKQISRVDSRLDYTADQVIQRAKSRIDENNYDLFDNNCEHFANWCRHGEAISRQASHTQTVLRQTAASAIRPLLSKAVLRTALRRPLSAPLILADLVQAGVEIAATGNGASQLESEKLGARAGAATSMGIGLAVAGPAGAASGLGLWLAGQLVGHATVRTSQQWLHRSAE